MRKVLIVLIVIPFLLLGIWLSIPKHYLQTKIEESFNSKYLRFETEGIKKGLFYSFNIDILKIKIDDKDIAIIENIHIPIKIPSLILLRLKGSFNGDISGGKISGVFIHSINNKNIKIKIKDALISRVPVFSNIGIEGSGTISGTITMKEQDGHAEFITNDARIKPLVISGAIIPLNLFNHMRGVIDIKGDTIEIVSIGFEGKDIYARLKGKITNTIMSLSLEVMPGTSFLNNPLFRNALEKYKVSPGYYVIPIKRNFTLNLN